MPPKLSAFGLPRSAGEEALGWFGINDGVPPPLPPREHSPEEIERMLWEAESRAKMDEVIDDCLDILLRLQEMGVQLAAEEPADRLQAVAVDFWAKLAALKKAKKAAARRNAVVVGFCTKLAAMKKKAP